MARGLARTSARSWRILVQTLSGPGAAVGRSLFSLVATFYSVKLTEDRNSSPLYSFSTLGILDRSSLVNMLQ